PYREMGYDAAERAGREFELGTAGAGVGALTAGLKGGLGSASAVLDNGVTVAALVAVNAAGTVTVGRTPHLWAAPLEIGDEFGGLRSASAVRGTGVTVAALGAATAAATVTVGRTPHFWAAPFEIGDEFGGLGLPSPMPADATDLRPTSYGPAPSGANTTLGI